MSVRAIGAALLGGSLVGGCSIIPPIPDDMYFPIREIIQHSACELQAAFVELSKPEYASFRAAKWAVAVKVTPKVDANLNGGVGYTGKSTTISGARYFNNWAMGSIGAPGAAADIRGSRTGPVTLKTSSKELLDPSIPLSCPVQSQNSHVLAQHLGIGEWLVRLVRAKDQAVGALGKLDSPFYSSQMVVKFSGNGNFTYSFPFGTNFGALGGYYSVDQTLDITLTPDTSAPPLIVQTLPRGGKFQNQAPSTVVFSSHVVADDRLDNTLNQQGIINAIKNLAQ